MAQDYQTVVHFHIGRGGRFHNGGFKTFEGVEDLNHFHRDWLIVLDTDEDGNPLPDEEWVMQADNGHIFLEGREAIESRTGKLDFDGIYDTDIFKYVEDCTEDEFRLLKQAIDNHDIEAFHLTDDDIDYINEYVD